MLRAKDASCHLLFLPFEEPPGRPPRGSLLCCRIFSIARTDMPQQQ